MILTYRYRVKSLNGLLNRQARAVSFVWNFVNDRQKDALRFRRKWHSAFDLMNLTRGAHKELGLFSSTVEEVCKQYVESRSIKNRPYLRYRGKKSLGWIPIKGRDFKRNGDAFRFGGSTFRVFKSRDLPEGKIKDGTNFSQDSRGNWFLNIVIEIETTTIGVRNPIKGVGVDLGLKEFATLSTGEKIDAERMYRNSEVALAKAQRAHKKRLVRAIHAKVAARRVDFHHKLSTRLVYEFDYIAVGNINAAALAKTSMAKSVLDAGWSSFRNMLAYKAIKHGAWYEEVNESFTTVTCSACGSRSGPSGLKDLRIREWKCGECGTQHDRDTNAALNILHRGRSMLAEGKASS